MAVRKLITPGLRYGRLVILSEAPKKYGEQTRVFAQCDCGKVHSARLIEIEQGRISSCGCLNRDCRKTHGRTGTRVYKCWRAMINRCTNPNLANWKSYGGRGIKVCDRWLKFENFLADMGEMPPEKTLDRFPDVNGNYEPGNCRWATNVEQSNNRRTNRYLEHDGKRMTVAEWSQHLEMSETAIHNRIALGWSAEKILTSPVDKSGPKMPDPEYKGRTQSLADWSRELGINYRTLRRRIRILNWPIEKAFEIPVRPKRK